MLSRFPAALALLLTATALLPAAPPPPPPIAYHKDLPTALKEANTLRIPTLVVLAKKTPAPPLDARVARTSRAFACAFATLTPDLAKQYELGDDALLLVLSPDGAVAEKFAEALAPEKPVAGLKKHVEAARAELLKDLKPELNANAKKAALGGLAHLGRRAEDLISLLTDPDESVKEAAKKALAAIPADAARIQLLDALKSEDATIRTAVHALAVQATGYKAAPLKVWQTGTGEERAAAWDKWNETVQTQFPPLNRAVLAYAEFSLGAQVTNGECSSLVWEAFKECKAKPMVRSGETSVWGRELKPGEAVLPGDIVQYEGAKFSNGITAPHHTAVIRKVLGAGKYETLEQNVNGVKKVQPGKLEMGALKEGTVTIYRPQPKSRAISGAARRAAPIHCGASLPTGVHAMRHLALFALVSLVPLATAAEPNTNIIFRGATIYDGTDAKPVVGDVHIKGEKIAAVGKVGKVEGAKEINAEGLVICPGFIDLHTHCDSGLVDKKKRKDPLGVGELVTNKTGRLNKNYVTQGCTTVITGNCGSGPVDAGAFFKALEDGGVGTNVIHLAPHNNIRSQVMGNVNRPPTADELKKMEELVDKAMKDGTWGLATGLIYNPGTYAKTDEIIALATVANKHGGMYASHIRNESGGLLDAIEEALAIGRESGCRVHISHIKASGKSAWGTSGRAVALIETARKKGQEVTADQYPYIASSTSLRATLVPTQFREGTDKEFVARLDDPTTGPKIKEAVEKALEGRDGGKRIQIARCAHNPKWQGKNITAIAEAEKKEPIDIVLEIERHGGASVVNFGMHEDDVRIYMKQTWVATASDGGVHSPGPTVPHPRSYGTFPRKIGFYAIEEKLIPVEQAIRASSGLPADILKLKDRGYLKPGYFADVVVFDPKTYRDTATFDKPHQYATGVKWVLVNGHPAVADGTYKDGDLKPEEHKGTLGGRVLRHPSK